MEFHKCIYTIHQNITFLKFHDNIKHNHSHTHFVKLTIKNNNYVVRHIETQEERFHHQEWLLHWNRFPANPSLLLHTNKAVNITKAFKCITLTLVHNTCLKHSSHHPHARVWYRNTRCIPDPTSGCSLIPARSISPAIGSAYCIVCSWSENSGTRLLLLLYKEIFAYWEMLGSSCKLVYWNTSWKNCRVSDFPLGRHCFTQLTQGNVRSSQQLSQNNWVSPLLWLFKSGTSPSQNLQDLLVYLLV